jgi:inward rectifier potassium channel
LEVKKYQKIYFNRDGLPIPEVRGLKGSFWQDLYHHFLRKSWLQTLLTIAFLFVMVNFIFTFFYFAVGGINNAKSFQDYFFFSIQTLSTIGYGFMYPTTLKSHFLVATESFFGLLFVSFLTGIVFSKFSLPNARVIFSKNAIVTFDEGNLVFQIRLANERASQLVDAQIKMTLLKMETKSDGSKFRRMYDMKLVRDNIPIFSLTFLAQHNIDDSSPFCGETHQSLVEKEAFVVVTLTGLDETISQTLHSRHFYTFEEIVWNKKFKDIIQEDKNGKTYFDYHNFDVLV